MKTEVVTIDGALLRGLIMAEVAKSGIKVESMTFKFQGSSHGYRLPAEDLLEVEVTGHRPKGTGLEGGK
jgi:hypothetical protein